LNSYSAGREEELKKLEDVIKKVKELDEKLKMLNEAWIKEIVLKVIKEFGFIISNCNFTPFQAKYYVKIVTSEEEIIELAKQGYDCQQIVPNKWLMRKQLN